MERRTGSSRVNFCEIARSLGISPMTVYRVVNNTPNVRRETRARVIDALNRHGYYTHTPARNIKCLFDFTGHDYLTYYGEKLMNNIARLNYSCFAVDHRRAPRRFFDLAAECDVAVFVSIPPDSLIDEVRQLNPDLYTITISTRSNADVTLSPDNTRGGEIAAHRFHELGCRHIAVHFSESHPTRMERFKGFLAETMLLDPACRIDRICDTTPEETGRALRNYFNTVDVMPSGVLFLAGGFAEIYLTELLEPEPERFGRVRVVTFDRPQDLAFRQLHYRFDRIEFDSPDLLDWAEYYITNRPMMKKRSPIHTSINVKLVAE